jgi:hypothetical protein
MIDDNVPQPEENKTMDLATLISRAEGAEEGKKFSIAANHYFTILSRHLTPLSAKPDALKVIIDTFIFNIILLPVGLQRERMLNFVLKNENLNIFSYKPFLEKM